MHHTSFYTKGIFRHLIVAGLFLALLLAPLPCYAAKKKKAKARAPKPRTVSVAKVQPSCPPGLPYEKEIQRFLGIPYRPGGTDERGMDCSGLARRFFSMVHGIELPRSSTEQSRFGYLDKVPLLQDEFEASDLLFFGPNKKRINHVGIYLADGKFLHASRKGGVIVSDLDEAYWKKRLISSRRLKDKAAGADTAGYGAENTFSYSDWRVKDAVNAEQTLAMGVSHSLVDSFIGVNLGAFHTTNLSTGDPAATYREAMAEGYTDVDHRQGVRAFVDLTPSQWLRITPSMSIVERFNSFGLDTSEQVYGLETAIHLPGSPWSLAVSAHSGRSSALYPWRLQPDQSYSQRGVDLAFSVGYRFGDSMGLSVYGSRDNGADSSGDQAGKNSSGGLNDLAVQLHWTF